MSVRISFLIVLESIYIRLDIGVFKLLSIFVISFFFDGSLESVLIFFVEIILFLINLFFIFNFLRFFVFFFNIFVIFIGLLYENVMVIGFLKNCLSLERLFFFIVKVNKVFFIILYLIFVFFSFFLSVVFCLMVIL